MAREALDAGANVLVAQETEAGGHGAARTTIDIVPAIVDLVRGQVPVVAAGGIADGRGLAASLMLGAAGALLGTRFYASLEADGHEEAKKRILLGFQWRHHQGSHFRYLAQQCLARAFYRPLPCE